MNLKQRKKLQYEQHSDGNDSNGYFEITLSQKVIQQIRANDPYGTFRTWADELLLKPYVVTKVQKRAISVEGEVDPITKGRIMAFYRRSRLELKTKPECFRKW